MSLGLMGEADRLGGGAAAGQPGGSRQPACSLHLTSPETAPQLWRMSEKVWLKVLRKQKLPVLLRINSLSEG